jgi:hypothetical protein
MTWGDGKDVTHELPLEGAAVLKNCKNDDKIVQMHPPHWLNLDRALITHLSKDETHRGRLNLIHEILSD